MIIFTSNINILQHVGNAVVYNLSSYYSGYGDITGLITKIHVFNPTPLPANQFITLPEFDNIYANSVLQSNELFYDFIKIMINSLEFNVIVLVSHDDYRDAIMESIIKLIQVRYGYNCWQVESIEDLECVKESFFTPYGILALDQDKKRFNELYSAGMAAPVNNLIDTEVAVNRHAKFKS